MNTVGDELVVVVVVTIVDVDIRGDAALAAGLCTIVVACGTETVRKTVPLGLVVIVVPFIRDFVSAADDCTSVTLIGATFGDPAEVRCCTALLIPLLLVSRLVPACITGEDELVLLECGCL